ncbi:MAG: hypothetical protein ACRCXM_02580 [Beijerinckiaceae bacterium]
MTDTTPTPLTPPDEDERDAMLGAIVAAWPHSQTPPDLRDACLAFATDRADQVEALRAILLITLGVWIEDIAEAGGHQRAVVEQIAAVETQRAIAMMMRAAKERDGQPYMPARQAIVGYYQALGVAQAEPFRCDVPGAVAAWRDGTLALSADAPAAHREGQAP